MEGAVFCTFIEGHQSDNKIGKYPFVMAMERCCVDADASSDSEEDNDEPPTSMFS